jgi:hypothetical protein
MEIRLEHANLCVRDIEAMVRFLKTAFPEFRARGEGKSRDGTRWVHIGTNDTYLALGQAKADYIAAQMPSETAIRWTDWQYDPQVGTIVSKKDSTESLPYNYVVFGVSRHPE